MRTTFLGTALSLISVAMLQAQDAGRTGNSSNSGQNGQNAANSGTNQNPTTPGQAQGSKSTGTGQNQTDSDQNRNKVNQTPTTGQTPSGQERGANRAGRDAQDAAGRTGRDAEHRGHVLSNATTLNSYFIACLRADNHNEVELGKLAAQRAANPEVKSFAQQMVKDHSAFLAKLDQLKQTDDVSRQSGATSTTERRGTSATTRPGTDGNNANNRGETSSEAREDSKSKTNDRSDATPSTDRAEKTQPAARLDAAASGARPADETANRSDEKNRRDRTDNATAQPGTRTNSDRAVHSNATRQSGSYSQLAQIKKEIADRCLASAQRDLSEKQGKDFDNCYIGMQVVAHMQMVDTLSVLSRHASGELQQVVTEGLETAQQHLEHVKQIAKQVDSSAKEAGVGRDEDTKESKETSTRNKE